jgi:Fic family protein
VTVGGKFLREHFEVTNHKDAIQYVEDLVRNDEPITAFHVRQIPKLILIHIDDGNAGSYRKTQVRIAGASFTPLESWQITSLMAEWSDWVASLEEAIHPITLAAQARHRLVAIHPFVDGNGRTARLVMNLLLMRRCYPPNRRPAGKPQAVLLCAG